MSAVLEYRDFVGKEGKNVPVTKEMARELHKGDNRYVPTSIMPTRATRRMKKQKLRFKSNKKGISLSIHKTAKYKRHIQEVDGKRIEHYLPA